MRRLVVIPIFVLIAFFSALAAAVVYIFFALITPALAVNLGAAGLVLGGVSYGLGRVFAGLAGASRPGRWAALVSGLCLVAELGLLAGPNLAEGWRAAPYPADEAIIQLLTAHSIPLATVQPGNDFADLQALKPILEGKRVIALGEATHGTHEFFQMKHRLLEFLAREMGVEHFGMETDEATARVINDYISGGSGDPRSVLYWPWNTREVLEMLAWMRTYNTHPDTARPLIFHGIDPRVGERDRIMAMNVAHILDQAGPQSKIVLWAHNAHISSAQGWMGWYLKQEFGEQAYLLGFEFNQGAFTSRMQSVHTYQVAPALPGYYAYALAQVGQPVLFVDFRTISATPELQNWLATPQRSHYFQEMHAILRLIPAWHTQRVSWLELFDGIIFVEESTPAQE